MGFGTLFFGYFAMFAFSLSQYYFFADIIGALVSIYAFSKLTRYSKKFPFAMGASLGFMILCAVNACSLMWGLYSPTGAVDCAVDIAKELFACLVHRFMFLGIRQVSQGAGARKLVDGSVTSMWFTMVYYVVSLAVLIFGDFLGDKVTYFSTMVYLYSIVCLVMNLVLIYRCFGILCPQDEDVNEQKRSKFGIINKMDDKMDAFEAKSNAYRRESMQMAMDEARKRADEKRGTNNKPRHIHNHSKKK